MTLDWAKREGESKMRVLPTMAGYARHDDPPGRLADGVLHERRHRRRRPARPRDRLRARARRASRSIGLRGRQAPGRPRRAPRRSAASPSTATTTRSPRPTTRSSTLAESLGLSIRWRPLGVGFYHDGRRCSMSTPVEVLTLPGPAARRQGAARRVRARLRPDLATTRRSTSSRSRRGRASSPATACGSACGRRCWTPSSTAATTTCPRPTCGRACAARPAPAPRAGARSWARSRAATRRSSTGSRSASARSAARSTPRTPVRHIPASATGRALGVVTDDGLREHDTVVTTQLRPNLQGLLAPELERAARAGPAALHGHRLPGRARQEERQPVLRDQHHRPPRADHERRRDHARRRSRRPSKAT